MFLSHGFRPFFLLGAMWAALAMVLWITMVSGFLTLPISMDSVSWHAHEFLFGYLGAILAGFLLTAVASWTNRPPVAGFRLATLVTIWLTARIAFAFSQHLTSLTVAIIDLSFPIFLAFIITAEIVAARNWRNLIVIFALVAFVIANGLFHLEAARGDYAAQGYGLRFGLAAILMQISIIGGRVVPAFTRNWMMSRGMTNLPSAPMLLFDVITLLVTLICLLTWVVWPEQRLTGFALIVTAAFQTARLLRWSGLSTLNNPLLFVLHAGYAFIPIGAFFVGLSIVLPGFISPPAAQHIWMSGAIGLMTLALMTRATLGHSGQELRSDAATNLIYLAIIAATLTRFLADITPLDTMMMYSISAVFWLSAFLGFSLRYFAALAGLPQTSSVQAEDQ